MGNVKVGKKYTLTADGVVFNSYKGQSPVSGQDCVQALNALNVLIDNNQDVINFLSERNKVILDALKSIVNDDLARVEMITIAMEALEKTK